jgi:histidinol-phosphate aminotransferase
MAIRLPDYLQKLKAYIPGKPIDQVRAEFRLDQIVKLASNENPLGSSPRALAAIIEQARFAYLYPDAGCSQLKSAISKSVRLPDANIVVGNGSDEMIHFLSTLLLSEGDNIVMGNPGFSRYESEAIVRGADIRKIPLGSGAEHDLDAMLAAVDEDTRIVWIANPNNPTGTVVRRSEFDVFLQSLPEHALTVLDEAYFEFADAPDYPNSAEYVAAGRNVVGLRTFSKTYGLAGLRVGYAMASVEIADALDKIREPFNVNYLAQIAAVAALEDVGHLEETIELNKNGVLRLREILESYGWKTSESYANFVWCDLGRPSENIALALLKKGIIVRPGSVFGCPNHLRVSVGTHEEVDRFRLALQAIDLD